MQPGQDAPRFTAPAYIDGEIKEIDLNDYRGHYIILIFYPEDFGTAITTQLIQIAQLKTSMPNDCVVLAVSTDSVESHAAYAELSVEKGGVKNTNIPLISDKNGEICRRYQVLHNATHVAASSGFVIDREGEIVMMYYCDDNLGYDMAEPCRIVLGAIACDKEEAWDKLRGTGADWIPGEPLVKVNDLITSRNIRRTVSHGEFKDHIEQSSSSSQNQDNAASSSQEKAKSPSPPQPEKAKSPSPAQPEKAKSPSPAQPEKAKSLSPAKQEKAKSPSPDKQEKAKSPSPDKQEKAKSPSPAKQEKAESPSPAPLTNAKSSAPAQLSKAKSPSPAPPTNAKPPSPVQPEKAKSSSPSQAEKAKSPSPAKPEKAKSPSPAPALLRAGTPNPPPKKKIDEDMLSLCSASTAGTNIQVSAPPTQPPSKPDPAPKAPTPARAVTPKPPPKKKIDEDMLSLCSATTEGTDIRMSLNPPPAKSNPETGGAGTQPKKVAADAEPKTGAAPTQDDSKKDENPFADVTSLAYTIAPSKHESILIPKYSDEKGKGMGKF